MNPAYDWVTVRETVAITENQHSCWAAPLFRQWTTDGWEVVSVMTLPPANECLMCIAVGTLRKARP